MTTAPPAAAPKLSLRARRRDANGAVTGIHVEALGSVAIVIVGILAVAIAVVVLVRSLV